jgi:hypothetical protein
MVVAQEVRVNPELQNKTKCMYRTCVLNHTALMKESNNPNNIKTHTVFVDWEMQHSKYATSPQIDKQISYNFYQRRPVLQKYIRK